MDKNKLGILNYKKLKQVEKEIISVKMKLLDTSINFNMSELNLEFLIRLHKFLFGDIYYESQLQPRNLTDEELLEISRIFYALANIGKIACCVDEKTVQALFVRLWDLQIFLDGNTRTLLAFLKLYIERYSLPVEMSKVDKISSSGRMFTLKRCQQKDVDNI